MWFSVEMHADFQRFESKNGQNGYILEICAEP